MLRVVLVGAGHAHLPVIAAGGRFAGCNAHLTIISPPWHDYSGMGPGVLSGRYPPALPRIHIPPLVAAAGGTFLSGQVTVVDPVAKTLLMDDGTTIAYDLLSFNTGSRVTLPVPAESAGLSVFPVKPISRLDAARERLLALGGHGQRLRVLVVGGGAAGCEMAGSLQELAVRQGLRLDITLVAGRQLLGRYPERTRHMVLKALLTQPLEVIEGGRVSALAADHALLDDGRQLDFDLALVASGIAPCGPFVGSGLPVGPQGGVAVNDFLQSPEFPEVFAGGDCLDFLPRPLPKVGVHAVRQGPVLLHNLLASCSDAAIRAYRPQRHFLLIFNLGLGRAVACGYGLSWQRPATLRFKEHLDRRFLRRFQILPGT